MADGGRVRCVPVLQSYEFNFGHSNCFACAARVRGGNAVMKHPVVFRVFPTSNIRHGLNGWDRLVERENCTRNCL